MFRINIGFNKGPDMDPGSVFFFYPADQYQFGFGTAAYNVNIFGLQFPCNPLRSNFKGIWCVVSRIRSVMIRMLKTGCF